MQFPFIGHFTTCHGLAINHLLDFSDARGGGYSSRGTGEEREGGRENVSLAHGAPAGEAGSKSGEPACREQG